MSRFEDNVKAQCDELKTLKRMADDASMMRPYVDTSDPSSMSIWMGMVISLGFVGLIMILVSVL